MVTPSSPRVFRLLLDQGFPQPPGFNPAAVDHRIEVQHLSSWAPQLSEVSTPDWVLYCEAAFAGFDALVTRDFDQAGLEVEMFALGQLASLHVVTFRKGVEDPISEWGQLLAYMPRIRSILGRYEARVIVLPKPVLPTQAHEPPRKYLAELARVSKRSAQQIRSDALAEVEQYEEMMGLPGRYTTLLRRKKVLPGKTR